MRTLLALLLVLPSLAYADAAVSTSRAAKLYSTVEIRGVFSARGSLDVNLINGPPSGGPQEPPSVAVPTGYLEKLNRELPGVVDEVVKQEGFLPTSGAMGGEMIALAREPAGDQFFALVVEASPGNNLGGHYGGLDLVTRLRSLQRKEELHNFGFATVAVGAELDARSNLRTALRSALAASIRDFHAMVRKPIGQVDLVFELSGLDAVQRAAVAARIAPCAAQMATPVDHRPGTVTPKRVTHTVWFRIGRWDLKETDSGWLDWYEQRLPGLAFVGKGQGCVEHTPLAGLAASVRRDGRALVVTFGPKK